MGKFVGGERVRILKSDKHDEFLQDAVGREGIVNSAYYESIDNTVSVILEGPSIDDSNQWYFDVDGLEIIQDGSIVGRTAYSRKNGIEDLKKARTYLNWLIEQEEAKNV